MSRLESILLVYLVWPTPNKGYKSVDLWKIRDHVRFNCFYDKENNLRQKLVFLTGNAIDLSGFQLTAASTLMSPNPYFPNIEVLYLTLGVGESDL